MKTQNVTLALPKELLQKVKLLAVKRRTSLSALLSQSLEDIVAREEGYAEARQRNLAWLDSGFDLGAENLAGLKREELHER